MSTIRLPHDFTPLPHQQPYMAYFDGLDPQAPGQDGSGRAMWVCHRRAGKDLTALHQTNKMAHQRIGLYWHMLPKLKQARSVIWNGLRDDGKRILDNVFPPELVASRNEQEMRLNLKCGSIVQVVGSDNYDSLVGANPVGCVFSEFALNHPAAWNYVRPMLAANRGWASFITTPRGHNHAYDQWKLALSDPRWFTALVTVRDTNRLPATIIEDELRAGMPEALVRQEYLCDWDAALVGSVWGDLIEQLGKRDGLGNFEVPRDGVFTAWDLGMSDATAIWFFRIDENGVSFIDHFEDRGKPLSYYCDVLDERGYGYVRHWLPHDANARHLGTEVTIIEQLRQRWGAGKAAIGPRMALLDGIQAGRWLLQQPGTRFHGERCAHGIEMLRQYAYEYDEATKTYSTKPAHDESSHTADAFRYASIVAKVSGIYRPKKATPPAAPKFGPVHQAFSLDQLYDMRDASRSFRRRVG